MPFDFPICHIPLQFNEQFRSIQSTNGIRYEIDTFGYPPWVIQFEKYTEWCKNNSTGKFLYYEAIKSNPFIKTQQNLYIHYSWYGIAFEDANDALLFKLTFL